MVPSGPFSVLVLYAARSSCAAPWPRPGSSRTPSARYMRGAPALRSLRSPLSTAYHSAYSAPSLEADRAPRMFRSINSTSALSLCIWVSVPESGRREGLGNQGGGTLTIYPMEQWQLEVWAHAFGISISSSGIFFRNSMDCIFGLFSSSRISHYTGNLRSYLWSEDMSSGSDPFYSNSSPPCRHGPNCHPPNNGQTPFSAVSEPSEMVVSANQGNLIERNP